MNLSDLLRDRKIEKIEISQGLTKRTFNLSLRDIKASKDNFNNSDYDWALVIAYNAMLQAGKAVMYSKGYRSVGYNKHTAVMEFIEVVLKNKIPENIILSFDKLRKKRHRTVYEEAELISKSEAEFAIKTAEEFVNKIKNILGYNFLTNMKEMIILVDKNDREIGSEEKIKAHENGGSLHRAFSIFVFDKEGRMLIQRRAMKKYHCAGLWTNACCSHPNKGEVLEKAVHRKLKQEFGFDTDLKETFSFIYKADFDNGLTEHELDHVFVGNFDGKPKPNPDEIDGYKWINSLELQKDVEKNPDKYTPWFKIALDKVIAYNNKK